jgi:NADP-dependent aldehyde dehydrogenase
MQLTGQSIIGQHRGRKTGKVLNGFNPATAEILPPDFYSTSEEELDRSVQLASESFIPFSRLAAKKRAAFLYSIAENLENLVMSS